MPSASVITITTSLLSVLTPQLVLLSWTNSQIEAFLSLQTQCYDASRKFASKQDPRLLSPIWMLYATNEEYNGNREDSKSNNQERPNIAIIGSGAVGCYYGARLWETQQYNLQFFMRGEHYSTSKVQGLNVTSIQGDVFIPPRELMSYNDVKDIGVVDWVIVAIKSTGIRSLPDLLEPLLGNHTRVIAIMNGLVDDDIVRLLEGTYDENDRGSADDTILSKCAAVYGGMAFLCSNRVAPGHIDHSYGGKLTASLARSRNSNHHDSILDHKQAILDLWEPTQGFEFCYDDNCVRARWSKALWNLPFNGISVAMNGITVDKIVQDKGLRRLAFKVMDETIEAANKDLEDRGYSKDQFLGDVERSLMMGLSDAMGPYKTSTMLDLTNGRPMEVKYLFRKFVDRADQLGVPVPTLETLVTQIEFLQRANNLV